MVMAHTILQTNTLTLNQADSEVPGAAPNHRGLGIRSYGWG